MKKVRLSELSEAVKSFLASANEGMIVEDTNGESRYGVIAYGEASEEAWQQAWRDIQQLQVKVDESMKRQGVTEDDVMQELLKDD